MRVRVELFGVPRLLTGRRAIEIETPGATLGEVARALGQACPELRGRVLDPAGWLLDGYLFAVGERFTRDAAATVPSDTPVLLVASSAGG
ncbi:MAG TPA: thiamine biosynthesis protein ThiS [Chloroflexota bacterium]|jgi:molybdopterin converting factor small subunit|nr:thiamine biosynthesis protein ThiS [Chloroflexota bacterium]